jgi:hypothetical protein
MSIKCSHNKLVVGFINFVRGTSSVTLQISQFYKIEFYIKLCSCHTTLSSQILKILFTIYENDKEKHHDKENHQIHQR